MRYQLDTQMTEYMERLYALSDVDLDRFSDYGTHEERIVARDYASGVCNRLFTEEVIRTGKESRYILTPENLSPEDFEGLQDLTNQTRLLVKREGEILVVTESEDPQGQQKIWANMVLRGLDGNKLKQCYEVFCRRLYVPDPIRARIQEVCSDLCAKRRAVRAYRKRKSR